MTQYALVIFEDSNNTMMLAQQAWQSATRLAQDRVRKAEGGQVLNEGTYLLHVQNGLQVLSQIVKIAADYDIRSHTLFFDERPSFIVS
jgi:hypothetical protein